MCNKSIILLLSLIGFLSLNAQTVTGDYVNTPISEILKDIKIQSDIKLAFDAKVMREIRATVQFEYLSVKDALLKALEHTNYEIIYIKNTWLVIPKEDVINKERKELKRNFKVSGRLIDATSGEALAYANISLKRRSGGAVSNLDGYFNLSNVAFDSIPLCVSYVGYRTRCIDLRAHETENMLIKLERADTYLKVVQVKDRQSADLAYSPIDGLVKLDAAALSRATAGPQPDLFRSVQTIAGVSSNDGLDAQLHIRGGEEDENLVLWDGFTLYHLDHFFGVFSTLNPSVIQQVSLHKDPFSSRYGGRSGGVLDVIGKSGNRNNWHTRVDMNLINFGVLTEGPISEKSSYLIAYRRSHTDFLRTGFYEELLDRVFAQSITNSSDALVSKNVKSDYFYHDLNMKWTIQASSIDRVSASLFNGGDSFLRNSHFRFEPENSPFTYNDIFADDSQWGNTGLGLVWTRNPKAGTHQYTSLGWSSYASDYYFSDEERNLLNGIPLTREFSASVEENKVRDLTLLHRRSRPMTYGRLEYGYQFTHIETTQKSTKRDVLESITTQTTDLSVANQHSLFADRYWTLKDRWDLRLGGRASSSSFTDKLYLEPRARIHYWLKKDLGIHLATGNYIQQIRRTSEQNLFLRQADNWVLSDGERIPESRSFHSSIGVNWMSNSFSLNASFFYKRVKGVIINQEQNRLLSAYTVENEGVVTGEGTVTGVDITAQIGYKSHSAWLSYSYTLSQNTIAQVNEGRSFPSAFNKPHDLKLSYNFRYSDYKVHTTMLASSGYPFTPVLGFFEGPGGDTFLVYGDDLSARSPALFRIDFSVNRSFSFNKMGLDLGVGVYNLTNHSDIRTRTYGIADEPGNLPDDLRINPIDLVLVGISPTFSVTLNLR